ARDAERVADSELLALGERLLELLAAFELARDDVRRGREPELLHLAGERHDVVDRHAGRMRYVNGRAVRELRADRVELALVVRSDLDRVASHEIADCLSQLIVR